MRGYLKLYEPLASLPGVQRMEDYLRAVIRRRILRGAEWLTRSYGGTGSARQALLTRESRRRCGASSTSTFLKGAPRDGQPQRRMAPTRSHLIGRSPPPPERDQSRSSTGRRRTGGCPVAFYLAESKSGQRVGTLRRQRAVRPQRKPDTVLRPGDEVRLRDDRLAVRTQGVLGVFVFGLFFERDA